jgi:hypothetical protein
MVLGGYACRAVVGEQTAEYQGQAG